MPSLGSLLGASPLVRDGVTVLSGVVRLKDPGHQGVSLSNLLSLDGGRKSGHRAQVKLETGLVQLEGLGADLTLLEGQLSVELDELVHVK
jgi:hypothetical protein